MRLTTFAVASFAQTTYSAQEILETINKKLLLQLAMVGGSRKCFRIFSFMIGRDPISTAEGDDAGEISSLIHKLYYR